MKKVLLHIPIVLSLLVLGAHFLRDADMIAVACCVALIALLFVRQWWVARLLQAVLVLGALEWAYTIYELVQIRTAHGQPVSRAAIILGVVAGVTLLSALLFQTKTLKSSFGLKNDN